MSLLDITVETGEYGPVVRLSGEADTSVADQLSDALSAQISGDTRHLTVDLSGLRFADSAAIRTLMDAHLALKGQGGVLELADPQPLVARTLRLLGIDQVIPVRPQAGPGSAGPGVGGSLRMHTAAGQRINEDGEGSGMACAYGPDAARPVKVTSDRSVGMSGQTRCWRAR